MAKKNVEWTTRDVTKGMTTRLGMERFNEVMFHAKNRGYDACNFLKLALNTQCSIENELPSKEDLDPKDRIHIVLTVDRCGNLTCLPKVQIAKNAMEVSKWGLRKNSDKEEVL